MEGKAFQSFPCIVVKDAPKEVSAVPTVGTPGAPRGRRICPERRSRKPHAGPGTEFPWPYKQRPLHGSVQNAGDMGQTPGAGRLPWHCPFRPFKSSGWAVFPRMENDKCCRGWGETGTLAHRWQERKNGAVHGHATLNTPDVWSRELGRVGPG